MWAVISALIAGYHSVVKVLSTGWMLLLRVFRRGEFAERSIEFLTEVAVLVFVFPILDTLIEKGQSKVTRLLVIWSILIPVGCLFLAGVISTINKED
jgi:hypothetical protein